MISSLSNKSVPFVVFVLCCTLIAVSIGGTVPLILKHFGIDPVVASGPLLTTVTYMAGFFLVLSLAFFFMPQLQL